MAKASNKVSLNASHRELVQNVLVDLVRATIQQGVSQRQLGVELMAQGYAILTGVDLAEARVAVAGMTGRGPKQRGALKGTSAKKPLAKKRAGKGATAKMRSIKKRAAGEGGTPRAPR
jgi:hypothetical protein